MTYVLHYAPDNASLVIRMALEHLGLPYRCSLVDRATQAQTSPAYLKINPNGLIPALETPQGAIFETGAILLWLADRHGQIGPEPDHPERGDFLKWLFYLSNTVHPALRMTFYPDKYLDGPDNGPESSAARQAALRLGLQKALLAQFQTLNSLAQSGSAWLGAPQPSALDFYLAALLRWPALYPQDTDRTWFDLSAYPALFDLCARLETLPCAAILEQTEGLGAHPFTAPQPANPPHGQAL